MVIGEKVNIILEEINRQAASIPSYMEEYYRQAVVTALARIDRQEREESERVDKWKESLTEERRSPCRE